MNHRNRHRAKTLEYLSIAHGDTVVTASHAKAERQYATAKQMVRDEDRSVDTMDALAANDALHEIQARAKRQKKGKKWIAAQLEKQGYTQLAATVRSS